MTDDRRQAMIEFAERLYSEMTETLIEAKQAVEAINDAGARGTRAVRKLQRNLEEIADLTKVLRDDGEPQ
jgi:hypothetical protein